MDTITNFILNPRVSVFSQEGGNYLFDPVSRTYASINDTLLSFITKPDNADLFNQLSGNDQKDLRDVTKRLYQLGILIQPEFAGRSDIYDHSGHSDSMTHLTLFVTTKCNLRCAYCYANGGDNEKTITPEIWQPAMDYFFATIGSGRVNGETGSRHVSLSIHGGGEPTMEFTILKEIVSAFYERANAMGLQPSVGMGTNGTYNDSVHRWIIENNISVNISLDGPGNIQNRLRPFRSGKPSFDIVTHNLSELVKAGRRVSIRATITDEAVETMTDTIQLAKQLGLAAVHFEPVSQTGRGETNTIARPDPGKFVQNFLQCFLLGLQLNIDVYYSGMRCFEHCHQRFCGACGRNLCITPDGNITTCYEVLDSNDPAAKEFFVGKIDTTRGLMMLDHDRIEQLKQRVTKNMVACKDCFLRYQCAGDCPAKSFRHLNRDLYSPDPYRCRISEHINKQLIIWLADGIIEPREVKKTSVFSLYN